MIYDYLHNPGPNAPWNQEAQYFTYYVEEQIGRTWDMVEEFEDLDEAKEFARKQEGRRVVHYLEAKGFQRCEEIVDMEAL